MKFGGFLASFLVCVTLSACQTTTTPAQDRSPPAQDDFAHLPDPATWSAQRMHNYFNGTLHTGDTFYHHTITARLRQKCGARFENSRGLRGAAEIRFYEQQLENLPNKAQCWVDNIDEVALARAPELVYLKEVARLAVDLPPSPPFYAQQLMNGRYDLNTELDEASREIENFVRVPAEIQKAITIINVNERDRRQRNRESWSRATTMAVESFARSNPFTQPPPGAGLSPRLTADVLRVTDPGVVAALNQYDRTVMGENAYLRTVLNRAAAAGQASARQRAAQGGSSMTLTRQCAAGTVAAGNCQTAEQLRQETADANAARDAMMEARATEAAERLRADSIAAEQRAGRRLDQAAQACGFDSYEAAVAAGGSAICQ